MTSDNAEKIRTYADLFGEINQFSEDRISACAEAGISAGRLILDQARRNAGAQLQIGRWA